MRRRLLATGSLALALVACNAILGLDGDTLIAPADGGSSTDVSAPPDATSADAGGPDAANADADADLGGGIITLAAGVLGGGGNADDRGENARFRGLTGLAVDKLGNRYVIDRSGTVIRKIDTTGLVTTFAGGPDDDDAGADDDAGTKVRFGRLSAIAYDGDHLLYAVDQLRCALLTIDTNTGHVTTLAARAGGCAGTVGPTALAIGDGSVLLYISDPPDLRGYQPDSGQFTLVCGPSNDASACTATVTASAMALDLANETLYFRDENAQLVRLGIDGGSPTRLSGVSDGADPLSSTTFAGTGLALAEPESGQVLVGDSRRIMRVTLDGGAVDTFSGSNDELPPRWFDAPNPLAARFEQIHGLSRVGPFRYEVADLTTVRAIGDTGVTTIAGRGRATGYKDGARDEALLGLATSLTLGPNGIAYFYDKPHSTVRSYDPATGQVKTVAGQADKSGQTDGAAGIALLDRDADGIVFDGTSIIYSSSSSLRIRSIDPTTGEVRLVTQNVWLTPALGQGPGNLVYSTGIGQQSVVSWHSDAPDTAMQIAGIEGEQEGLPVDGTGSSARFGLISSVCFDASLDAIIVADQGARAIRKVQRSNRDVTTIAGTLGAGGYADGVGANARFGFLARIACDGKGHAYVTEPATSMLRGIDLVTGKVTTVAGVFGRQGIALGPLPGGLNEPLAALVLPNGHLLVSSGEESAIVEIALPPQ